MTAERIASGRAVINDFKAGTLDGIKTYDRICKALDLIGRWSAETVTNFVEQFADIDDLLDEDCTALVEKLCHIEWRFIPRKSRPQFVQLLRRIGMQHVVHTKSVVDCFVFQFLAPVQPVALIQSQTSQAKADEVSAFELILPDDELEENFHLAHSSLTLFLQCLPVSLILIRKSVMRYYPHFSCPKIRYVLYVRNILLLASFHSVLRNDIWSLIVENLAQFDAHVSQGADNSFNTATDELSKNFAEVFIMDEDAGAAKSSLDMNGTGAVLCEKLDTCLVYIYMYLAKAYSQQLPRIQGLSYDWIPNDLNRKGLYIVLRDVFEERMLMTGTSKNIAFIWLYICNVNEGIQRDFLHWLWSFVLRPFQSPAEWKKAHGAACYIGGLLSRARYITVGNYIDETVDTRTELNAGTIRHGTFYSVCQTILLTFCFRYREMDRNALDATRAGLSRIIHCSLEPLRYITQPIAKCFASISRSLQLVYCDHLIGSYTVDQEAPFETVFPFDSYSLVASSVFISSLVRSFSPLAEITTGESFEHIGSFSKEMTRRNVEETDGSFDFLNDMQRDDEMYSTFLPSSAKKSSPCKSRSISGFDANTVYARSPGLCPFVTMSSSMDVG